jgi:hypothetical protein
MEVDASCFVCIVADYEIVYSVLRALLCCGYELKFRVDPDINSALSVMPL